MNMSVKIAANGRLVLPKSARKALGLEDAGVLTLAIDGDEVRLTSIRAGIRRAQALYREQCNDPSYTTDDFLRERREETTREDAKEASGWR
jgi:bifunctional DNA-binding transcriptional regulator/antitoxin component of YhaV-PrlF toxin-antitoxin module